MRLRRLPLKGAHPAAWQSQFRGCPGLGGAGFMRCGLRAADMASVQSGRWAVLRRLDGPVPVHRLTARRRLRALV